MTVEFFIDGFTSLFSKFPEKISSMLNREKTVLRRRKIRTSAVMHCGIKDFLQVGYSGLTGNITRTKKATLHNSSNMTKGSRQ